MTSPRRWLPGPAAPVERGELSVASLKREGRKTLTTRLREQPTALGDVLLRRIGAQSREGVP